MKLESWEFDVIRIYNPLRLGHLQVWFDFLWNKIADIPGDVVEAGVFRICQVPMRGNQLIVTRRPQTA